MDETFKVIVVILLFLQKGVDSQYRYNHNFKFTRNYERDYPDIIDYDDTRSGNKLGSYLLDEQYARDITDPEEIIYDIDNYRSDEYIGPQVRKKHNDRKDAQSYKKSHAFLAKDNQQYKQDGVNEENSHGDNFKNLLQKKKNSKGALKHVSKNDKSSAQVRLDQKIQKPVKTKKEKDEMIKNSNQAKGNIKKALIPTDKIQVVQDIKTQLKEETGTTSTVKRVSTSQVPSSGIPRPKKVSSRKDNRELDDAFFAVVVAACSVAGIAGLALAGYCWYKLRKESTDVKEGEIVGYSSNTGEKLKANLGGNNGDEKLTKSAEMYHYLHAKKHLTAMESNGKDSTSKRLHIHDASDTSDEESDNTVYECPGLAPPGDMKVVNPLFSDAESRHSDRHSDHHSDAKSEESASSSPPYRLGRSSVSSSSSKP